eukprot:4530209-Amphidinium_carterae.1
MHLNSAVAVGSTWYERSWWCGVCRLRVMHSSGDSGLYAGLSWTRRGDYPHMHSGMNKLAWIVVLTNLAAGSRRVHHEL